MYHVIVNELRSKWKLCQCSSMRMHHVIMNELKSKWKLCQCSFCNCIFRLSINKLIYQCSKYAFHELTFLSCKCKPKMKSSPWLICQVLLKHGFLFDPWHFNTLQFNVNFNVIWIFYYTKIMSSSYLTMKICFIDNIFQL